MLRLLGFVYYALAALALLAGVLWMNEIGGAWMLAFCIASALSSAFFGAMCFVADDIRSLLVRLADRLAPLPEQPDVPIEDPSAASVSTPEQAEEALLMAEYDIVHDGASFLAYGRVRHESLAAAIAYVKSTRGGGD